LKDVLQGVKDLHHSEIIHGDLKGANILVNSEGRAVLADLGISRLSTADLTSWTSCQTTNRLGTLKWQSRNTSVRYCGIEPTEAGDIYALGCVAYEVRLILRPLKSVTIIHSPLDLRWSYPILQRYRDGVLS
ncbi:kinase-like protein, partial [Coprinellus micaceus]